LIAYVIFAVIHKKKIAIRGKCQEEVPYLELTEKLAGKEGESDLPVSLADGPPIALLLTALVQLPAWYLCISPNYNQHTALGIIPQVAVKAKLQYQLGKQKITLQKTKETGRTIEIKKKKKN